VLLEDLFEAVQRQNRDYEAAGRSENYSRSITLAVSPSGVFLPAGAMLSEGYVPRFASRIDSGHIAAPAPFFGGDCILPAKM
jgi:hypothetical protein